MGSWPIGLLLHSQDGTDRTAKMKSGCSRDRTAKTKAGCSRARTAKTKAGCTRARTAKTKAGCSRIPGPCQAPHPAIPFHTKACRRLLAGRPGPGRRTHPLGGGQTGRQCSTIGREASRPSGTNCGGERAGGNSGRNKSGNRRQGMATA
jgi:hypothetical protein